MRIIFNYKPFEKPKRAIYAHPGNDYINDVKTGLLGWSNIEKEVTVIGEDDTTYIEKLKEHLICDTNDPDYGETVLMPIGFHKSRLIRWVSDQLGMF